jgi:FixJ family two-component response regulator
MPIIVVTATSNPMLRTRALENGAFAYLEKPVKDRVLVDHIMSALREGTAQA